MQDSRSTFLKAIEHFPKWMDIRKRPFKSNGGHFLRSVIEEQDNIHQAIIDYKKDFFIINYIGREHTVIDYLYAAQVGDINNNFTLISPAIPITTNAKEFYISTEPIALWQEGYLLFRLNLIPGENPKIFYEINSFNYSASAVKFHVWNIIDEFAMFSGLGRYEDETNAQLLKRTLLVYKNFTNSTEIGLKNAIINAVSNYAAIDYDDIIIEPPNENNLFLPDDEFETLYERLAQFNKDIYRTKKWDLNNWEHGFKTLEYLPHIWDAQISDYQNGVGQNNALETILTDSLEDYETTDVQVVGYQKSDIQINEYIRSQRFETDINLSLKKFDNILKPQDIEYKITASETKELQLSEIILESYKQAVGESEHYLSDLVTEVRGATIVPRGVLASNSKYRLKFYPKNKTPYTDMLIWKANLVRTDGQTTDLLTESGPYKKIDGILKNTDVFAHIASTKYLKTFNNIVNVRDGITLSGSAVSGNFAVDITGMGGKLLKIDYNCRPTDITKNTAFVKPTGFVIDNDDKLVAAGSDSNSNIIIELDCNSISWEMENAATPSQQGSCTVAMYVDGIIDAGVSGLWTTGQKIERKFSKMSHIKIQIQKSGMNPVIIKNIAAARYEIKYHTEKGSIIETPFSAILPVLPEDENNTLYVDVKTYSAFAPVIHYVHIGASLGNAVYITQDFTTDTNSYSLDISSNCTVELCKITGSTETIMDEDFITKPLYQNNSGVAVSLIIDTSRFLTISRSTPEIEHTTEAGTVINFITLQPGQELDKITIEGNSLILVESASLNKYICPTGSYKVFISKILKGFVLKDTFSQEEILVHLTRNKLSAIADAFKLKNVPLDTKSSFITDKINNVEIISNSIDVQFEEIYLFPVSAQEYIAYNKLKMLKNLYQGVSMVDTFMPLIPPNSSVIYVLNSIDSNVAAIANFEKIKDAMLILDNWSLGPKTICVEINIDHKNSNNYQLELKQLHHKFAVSNNIDLDAEYEVEGKFIELAQYIIVPPNNMKVTYEVKNYSEKIIIEEDGFNKLYYSNIEFISRIMVNNTLVPTVAYELMNEEGIIIWKNNNYDYAEAEVFYNYKSPQYLSYISLEHLYSLVGYSVDAYRVINSNPIELSNLSDGSVSILDFEMAEGQFPDKIVTKCSNPNFQAKIENGNILKITKINSDNVVAVRAGFFYEDGLEYYQFNNRHTEPIDRMSNIELHHVQRYGNSLLFIQKSTNHLLDSSMRVRRTGELCIIDFINNEKIDGLSRINSLTACESYNCWIDFDMDIALKTGFNGVALEFSANNDKSYAIMNISNFIKPNTLVTLVTSGSLTVQIAKEVKHLNTSFTKALFAEPYAEMEHNGIFQYFIFDDKYEQQSEYYLLVTGSGSIDDIIVKDYIPDERLREIHIKNIDALNLNIVEKPRNNYIQRLLFDIDGNQFNGLEIDNHGILQAGSNVDWGLTKIYDARSNWDACIVTNAKIRKNAIYSENNSVIVETPGIYLRNRQSIKSLFVKVNDILINGLMGFKITLFSANSADGYFNQVGSHETVNVLQVFQNKLSNYVKAKIEMPADSVINNIEVFAEYIETVTPLHVITNQYGNIITKVYDTTYMAKFKFKGIEASNINLPDKIRISVRACREDINHAVWTAWKDIRLDENMKIIGDALVFDDYRFFQFRICLDDELAKIKIISFNFEVIG